MNEEPVKPKRGRPFGTFHGKYPTMVMGKLTRMYRKYRSMIARCHQVSHPAYQHYALKRGIKVCDRWRGKGGFDNFMDDIGCAGEHDSKLTLDRINNNGNYEPGNVRWATWKEQANNRSQRKSTEPNCLRQKAIRAGLPYHVVYQRVKIHNWPEEKALSTPVLGLGRQRGQMMADLEERLFSLPNYKTPVIPDLKEE